MQNLYEEIHNLVSLQQMNPFKFIHLVLFWNLHELFGCPDQESNNKEHIAIFTLIIQNNAHKACIENLNHS